MKQKFECLLDELIKSFNLMTIKTNNYKRMLLEASEAQKKDKMLQWPVHSQKMEYYVIQSTTIWLFPPRLVEINNRFLYCKNRVSSKTIDEQMKFYQIILLKILPHFYKYWKDSYCFQKRNMFWLCNIFEYLRYCPIATTKLKILWMEKYYYLLKYFVNWKMNFV